MKREARLLLDKASASVLLSIEFFNRPHDRGRVSSTLILLDHAFEMLLKAALVHRGGRIRERRARETIGVASVERGRLLREVTALGTLNTANKGYNVALTGSTNTVTNAVNFLNTGTVTLGDGGDTFTFTGGVATASGLGLRGAGLGFGGGGASGDW